MKRPTEHPTFLYTPGRVLAKDRSLAWRWFVLANQAMKPSGGWAGSLPSGISVVVVGCVGGEAGARSERCRVGEGSTSLRRGRGDETGVSLRLGRGGVSDDRSRRGRGGGAGTRSRRGHSGEAGVKSRFGHRSGRGRGGETGVSLVGNTVELVLDHCGEDGGVWFRGGERLNGGVREVTWIVR
ncbi:hypothetical protein Pcinc_009909 [Petrolisthes cinctipes]|uniref:Uncharacterized protein n=1 Tax=Petrolisthes cinctipes TaxID=88211 RepID=A0AAE1KU83_PETCI|nr:hypothetical protein Pcinc_009909 [Petrolisthes cinctipes]